MVYDEYHSENGWYQVAHPASSHPMFRQHFISHRKVGQVLIHSKLMQPMLKLNKSRNFVGIAHWEFTFVCNNCNMFDMIHVCSKKQINDRGDMLKKYV